MAPVADEHAMRRAREEEAALALWSTLSHPAASEAEWRRLPEEVRRHYRRQARLALGFDPRGFDAHGAEAYGAEAYAAGA
jgi:hypothetical protein